MSEEKIDLDKVRDDKCVPVAQGVLSDLVEVVFTDTHDISQFNMLLIKILQRSLDADLNLTTENPYIFQLILGVFGAFSTTVQKSKIPPTDDARFAKIGREMLAILVKSNVPMGKDVKPEDQEKALEATMPELEALFESEKLTWLEIRYILEGLFNSLKMTEQLFTGNMAQAVQKMEEKILGLENFHDLSMQKLDEVLKTEIADLQKPPEPVEEPKEVV